MAVGCFLDEGVCAPGSPCLVRGIAPGELITLRLARTCGHVLYRYRMRLCVLCITYLVCPFDLVWYVSARLFTRNDA
jgi:hypothetical protein